MSRKRRRDAGYPATVRPQPVSTPAQATSGPSTGLHISPTVMDGLAGASYTAIPMSMPEVRRRYAPPMTLGTPEDVYIACDNQLEQCGVYSLLQHSISLGQMPQTQFMGYGTLQQISQNGVIRACIETITDDMTRNWIELKREGEGDEEKTPEQQRLEEMGLADIEGKSAKEDQLAQIVAEMDRLNLQRIFHDACALVGYMGGALVYIDTGVDDPETLRTPLNMSEASAELQPDRTLRFVPIDPINVFPGLYNSIDPLREDYFKPRTWWVLGREVHHTRLLRLVANELPVLLKPAYNFLGMAQAQILWDYVMHFQNVRIASQRLLSKFSLTVMKTDMSNILTQAGGTEDLDRRVNLLVNHRSNDGVQVIDKEGEDILKLETPLSGVTDIVRQSLEILAAMNRTPAVKLLGISPSGFNATGESDIRNYYDHILSQQEKVLRPALTTVLKLLQLHLFGKVDDAITFDFAALSEADQAAEANTQKVKADTMAVLLDRQVVSPEECRRRLADDPDSGFADIDVDDVPEPQEGPEGMGQGMQGMVDIDDVDKAGAVFGGDAALDADRWITVHPNGMENKGKPALIDGETGVVKGGMGGKFNGQHISQAKSGVGAALKQTEGEANSAKKLEVTPSPDPQKTAQSVKPKSVEEYLKKENWTSKDKKNLKEMIRELVKNDVNDPMAKMYLEGISEGYSSQEDYERFVTGRTNALYENAVKRHEAITSSSMYPAEICKGVARGIPMSFKEANGGRVNPQYRDDFIVPKDLEGYRTNCQTCVVAYEARRRGYNVEALPNRGSKATEMLRSEGRTAWLNPNTGNPPKDIVYDGDGSPKNLVRFLDKNMLEGGRYFMHFGWKNSGTGHIVCVYKDKGTVYMYDPQTGKNRNEKQINELFTEMPFETRMKKLGIYRVDDCAVNTKITSKVLRAAK